MRCVATRPSVLAPRTLDDLRRRRPIEADVRGVGAPLRAVTEVLERNGNARYVYRLECGHTVENASRRPTRCYCVECIPGLTAMGDQLRAHRLAAGVSQWELAEISSLPRSAVSLYELGYRNPSPKAIAAIEEAIGARIGETIPTATWRGETKTVTQWAHSIGITGREFCGRLAEGGNTASTYATPTANLRALRLTHDGTTRTAEDWAEHLGIQWQSMRWRLGRYEHDDPRVFRPTRRKDPRVLRQSVAGSGMTGHRVTHGVEEAKLREAVIQDYLQAFPWLRSNAQHPDQAMVLESLSRVLGAMSTEEVAMVFGTTRARIQQIEILALKKCKLAGGQELRDGWEYRETTLVDADPWEAMIGDVHDVQEGIR